MKWIIVCLGLILVLAAENAFSQECPKWGDAAGALKYLEDNKANSSTLDPVCINRAFATLSHSRSSAEALVGLLDFERSTEHDDFKTRGGKYPAIGALMSIGKAAIAYLIKAIKESDSELVRTNAGDALGAINRPLCPRCNGQVGSGGKQA